MKVYTVMNSEINWDELLLMDATIMTKQLYQETHSKHLSGLQRRYGYVTGSLLEGSIIEDGLVCSPLAYVEDMEVITAWKGALPYYEEPSTLYKNLPTAYVPEVLCLERGVYVISIYKYNDTTYIHFNGPHGLYINIDWYKDGDLVLPGNVSDALQHHNTDRVYKAYLEIIEDYIQTV